MRLVPRTVRARVIVALTVVMTATAIVFVALPRGAAGVPLATVTRGDYTDVIEIRGEVRPVKTTYVSAPRNAGELLIVKISKNGTAVKAGEIVAEFDAVTVRRTIQEKQSELRSAIAERDQAKAQARITLEERAAAVRRASFDLQRAKLGLGNIEFVSKIDAERAKLAVTDAEHKLREA